MKVIDLTLTLEHGMRGVEFTTKYTIAEHGWNARTLHLYSHCGTHMDAPLHFAAGPQTIDNIPLDDCLGPAWLVPLDEIRPQELITLAHLGDVVEQIQPRDALLLRTGWSRHVSKPTYYRDCFPRISLELAEWMVHEQVRLVGIEPPSVADVNNLEEVTAVHKVLLGGNVIIVESLTHLNQLTGPKVFFGALPLKVADGDGAPCRAFAVEGGLKL